MGLLNTVYRNTPPLFPFFLDDYGAYPQNISETRASAPGRFSFPSEVAPWPYGMGKLKRKIKYTDPSEIRQVEVSPNPATWTEAAKQNILVVVGALDLARQPKRPGHNGKTRIDLAKSWVREMNKLRNHLKRMEKEAVCSCTLYLKGP